MVGCDRCNSHWFYASEAYLTAIISIHPDSGGDFKVGVAMNTEIFLHEEYIAECDTVIFLVC